MIVHIIVFISKVQVRAFWCQNVRKDTTGLPAESVNHLLLLSSSFTLFVTCNNKKLLADQQLTTVHVTSTSTRQGVGTGGSILREFFFKVQARYALTTC